MTTQVQMLMCHKVTHKKLIDNSPLFRKNFKVEFHGSHTNCVAYNLLYARVEFGHHLGTIYGKSTMKTEGKRNADNSQKRSVHAGFRRFPIP